MIVDEKKSRRFALFRTGGREMLIVAVDNNHDFESRSLFLRGTRRRDSRDDLYLRK